MLIRAISVEIITIYRTPQNRESVENPDSTRTNPTAPAKMSSCGPGETARRISDFLFRARTASMQMSVSAQNLQRTKRAESSRTAHQGGPGAGGGEGGRVWAEDGVGNRDDDRRKGAQDDERFDGAVLQDLVRGGMYHDGTVFQPLDRVRRTALAKGFDGMSTVFGRWENVPPCAFTHLEVGEDRSKEHQNLRCRRLDAVSAAGKCGKMGLPVGAQSGNGKTRSP